MRNIILGGAYLSEGASASANGTAAGYAAANAVALDRGSTWKADGTSSEWLALDLGSAKTPTFLGIANANFTKWTSAKLQHSSDGSAWTDFLDPLPSLPAVDSTQDYWVTLTAAPSRQHWRIFFTTVTAAPELALFYLGTQTLLSKNPAYGEAVEEDVFNVAREKSEGEVLVAEETARRLARFDYVWPTQTAAERDEIRDFIRIEGGPLRPFFFVPIDESGSSTAGRAYLVRYEPLSLAVRRKFHARYSMGFSLLEEV